MQVSLCVSVLILFWSLYTTNDRFHVTVGLFSNRSQKTSKCGKNIGDTFAYGSCATTLFLPHLTSSAICYWTDAWQHGIYLLKWWWWWWWWWLSWLLTIHLIFSGTVSKTQQHTPRVIGVPPNPDPPSPGCWAITCCKILKISPSLYKPLQILAPQNHNPKNPPLNRPSEYTK